MTRRAHPNNGDPSDPAAEEALQRRKDRLAALQREDAMADQHLVYVQELLRGMSEDEHCKTYRSVPRGGEPGPRPTDTPTHV